MILSNCIASSSSNITGNHLLDAQFIEIEKREYSEVRNVSIEFAHSDLVMSTSTDLTGLR